MAQPNRLVKDFGGEAARRQSRLAWLALLDFLAARAIPGVEHVADGVWRRSFALGGRCGTIEATWASDACAMGIAIDPPEAIALPDLAPRLARVFDSDTDPLPIVATLSRDPLLGPRLAMQPGLRVPGAWDAFELAVRAILGQQITVAGASRLAGRLVAAFGEPLPPPMVLPGVAHLFPSPARLAEADIAAMGMPRARAAAIRGLAASVAADPALLQPTASLDADAARLRRLPGIGEWTAQYVAMRALRHADAFPASDIGLLRAATTTGEARPSPAQLLARAESWRPFRAYAAICLWTRKPEPACV